MVSKMVMKRFQQERKDKMLSLVGKAQGISALDVSLSSITNGSRFLLEGDFVEVKQKEKGLRGSWHPAVVVEVLPCRRVVEYEELVTPGGLKLRETVYINEKPKFGYKVQKAGLSPRRSKERLRPRPPPSDSSPPKSWTKGTWVDCLYEDSWWEGILNEDIQSSTASKTAVSVFFPDEKDISQHDVNNLRLTQDWDTTSGTWTRRVRLVWQSEFQEEVDDPGNNREPTDRNEIDQFCDINSRALTAATITSSVTEGCPNEREHAHERSGKPTLDHIVDEEENHTCEVRSIQDERFAQASNSNTDPEPTVTEVRQMLKDDGKRALQTKKSRRSCRSPGGRRYLERSKVFSTLSSVMSYYAKMNTNGAGGDSTGFYLRNSLKNQQKSLVSTCDQINSTGCAGTIVLRSEYDTKSSHVDHVDLTEEDARIYLKAMGWDVSKIVRQDGKPRWIYKTPPDNQYPARVFYSLCGALIEYNRRRENGALDTGLSKFTIGIRRNRQGSTISRNNICREENLTFNMSNKRLRRSEKLEGARGEDINSKPNLTDFRPGRRKTPSRSGLREVDYRDKSVVDTRKRSSNDDTTSKEFQIVVNNEEARDYLRAASWEVNEVVRKSTGVSDWSYKAPAFGNKRAAIFHSLCSAIIEYNMRVCSNNKTNTEQKPTIHLVRRRSHMRKLSPEIDEVKSESTNMDEAALILSCWRETTALKPSSSPCSSSKQEKGLPPEGTNFEKDTLDSSEVKISGIPLQFRRVVPEASTSEDRTHTTEKNFGTFVGDIFEDDRVYLLEINILNLKKENLRIFIENENLLIKAAYSSEGTNRKFSTICAGDLSCKLTLPDDAIQESITAAQLKPGILLLTIPKSTKVSTKLEIPIR